MTEILTFLRARGPELAGIILLLALSLLIHAALVTRFSFDLFSLDWHSYVFNLLSESLLKGETGIPKNSAAYEGYTANNKTVVYFGIFPALLRIPFSLAGYGSLALNRVSCLLASFLFSIGAAVLLRNASPGKKLDFASWRLFATVILGSPALFLSFWGAIYHESLWWALASSCWATIPITSALRRGSLSKGESALLGTASAICLCSRMTFAIPLIASGVWLLVRQRAPAVRPALNIVCAWLTPLIIGAAICGWYNYDRYGSPFTLLPPPDAQYLKISSLGGHFNIRRMPSNALTYLGLTTMPFSNAAPYVSAYAARYFPPELFFATGEDAVSLSMTCPLLVALLAAVLFSAIRRRRIDEVVLIVIFGTQVLLILCYYAATLRYTAEFMPLFLLCAALTLQHRLLRLPPALLSALACWSIYISISIGIAWEMKWRYQRHHIGADVLAIFIRPRVDCAFTPEVFTYYRDSSVLGSDSQFECISLDKQDNE